MVISMSPWVLSGIGWKPLGSWRLSHVRQLLIGIVFAVGVLIWRLFVNGWIAVAVMGPVILGLFLWLAIAVSREGSRGRDRDL